VQEGVKLVKKEIARKYKSWGREFHLTNKNGCFFLQKMARKERERSGGKRIKPNNFFLLSKTKVVSVLFLSYKCKREREGNKGGTRENHQTTYFFFAC